MAFLTAQWRKLAIVNYEIDPEVLRPFVPAKTELDTWNDRCYVSLVGFRFLETRLRGVPVPFHINFEEINLRFYVVHRHETETRRGVVFIREIVARPALSLVANMIYAENYETLTTNYQWKSERDRLHVEYSWKKGNWHTMTIAAENRLLDMPPGSEEEFITEHYWGYTKVNAQTTSEYHVQHPRWQVYPVKDFSVEVDFQKVYGDTFGLLNGMQPASVMLAEGSSIAVMPGRKI